MMHESQEITNEDQQITFDKRPGTSGAACGHRYEITLVIFFLLQGKINKKIVDFYLSSNMDGVGAFDDVVFCYTYYNKKGVKKTNIIFLQAKHKGSTKSINLDKELLQENGDFDLRKYFSSYKEIKPRFQLDKDHLIFKNQFDDSNYFIYTNASLNSKNTCEKIKLIQKNIMTLKENKYYKVKYSDIEKQSIDFEELVRELVESVLSKTINGDLPIFKDYKKSLLKTVIEIKNNDGVFRNKFLINKKDQLRNKFLEEISKKYDNKSEKELLKELKELKIKLNGNFGVVEESDLELELPCKLFVDNEMKEFLDRLRIFGSQFNEKELMEKIITIIKSKYLVDETEADLIFSEVYSEVETWWLREKTYLTKKNVFFETAKQKISKLTLVGLASLGKAKINTLKLIFKNDHVENLMKSISNNQILDIDTKSITLTIAKVYQVLESLPDYKSTHFKEYDYKYMFVNSVLTNNVPNTFKSTQFFILVLVCERNTDNFKSLYKKLSPIIKSDNKKKIIMIRQEDNRDTILEKITRKYTKYTDNTTTLLDLNDMSQKKLIKKVTAIFQGEELILDTLLKDGEVKKSVDEKILPALVNTLKVEIGEELINLGEVEKYYISRIFNRRVKIKADIETESSHFFITNKNIITKQNIEPNKDILVISDTDSDFHKICKDERYNRKNIHWLIKEKSGLFIWQQSRGSLWRLRNFIDTESINSTKEEDMIKFKDKVVIISAEPGMGKSTVLTKLAKRVKKSDVSLWVQTINLCDHIDHLKDMDVYQDKKEEAIKVLLDIVKPKSGLDTALFKRKINDGGKIVFLFDGFDEISPRHNDKVIGLLKVLKDTKVTKMWLTTRPHMSSELEDKLGVISYTLKSLIREDQVTFLKNFWIERLGLKTWVNDCFNSYICQLLDLLEKSITDKENEFTGVPLQTRIFGEVFQDEFKHFYDTKEITKLPERMDLVDLYQKLINIKYFEKTKEGEYNIFSMPIFLRNHKLLAMDLLFNHDLKVLLSDEEETDLQLFKNNFKKGKEKTGLVNDIINERPSFIHRTVAEYFAAFWFAEKVQENNKKIKEFLLEHIFKKEYKLLQIFLDRLLAKDNQRKIDYKFHNAVLNNDKNEVISLLVASNKDIVTFDKGGKTGIHLAAAYGYEYIVEVLLDNSKKEGSLFRDQIDTKDKMFNWSALKYAFVGKYWNIVELLLKNGAKIGDIFEPNSKIAIEPLNETKETLLHIVVKKDYVKFTEVLIKKGANVHAKDIDHSTPLHVAAKFGNANVMKVLLKHTNRYNIDCEDIYGRTPLYTAAENEKVEVLKLLVCKGANINANNASSSSVGAINWSILHIAAYIGNAEIVEFLINKGADPYIIDSLGRDPLYISIEESNAEVTKFLDNTGDSSIFIHTLLGNLEFVKNILEDKSQEERKIMCNPNQLGKHGPLHIAARNGFLDIVKLLVQNGADINIFGDGLSALHMSASRNHEEIVEFLIKEAIFKNGDKFDILKFQDISTGWTVLHGAAKNGHTRIVEYIIQEFGKNKSVSFRKALINAADSKGTTLLQTAAFHGKLDTVKFLIKNGANINAIDIFGATPLFGAACMNNSEVVEYLLNYKETNIYCDSKKLLGILDITPLHLAAGYDNLDMLKLLLDKSRVDAGEKKSLTPLHVASIFDSSKVIEYLVNKKANTNVVINFTNIIQTFYYLKNDFKGGYGSKTVDFFIIFLYYLFKIPRFGLGFSSQFTPTLISLALKHNNPLVQNCDDSQCVHRIVSFALSLSWSEKQLKMMKEYVKSIKTGEPLPPVGEGNFFYDILNNNSRNLDNIKQFGVKNTNKTVAKLIILFVIVVLLFYIICNFIQIM